jgi:hypothetical protein
MPLHGQSDSRKANFFNIIIILLFLLLTNYSFSQKLETLLEALSAHTSAGKSSFVYLPSHQAMTMPNSVGRHLEIYPI